jgi:hypothetical protein
MTKIKALFGLTALVALLAISAAPASAWFKSTSTKTSGVGTAGKTTFTTGTLSVTCEKAEGEWKVRLKTTQAEALEGPHLNILAKKWNNCKNSIFGGATVKECEFQVEQPTKKLEKEFEATATKGLLSEVITGCEIKALGCTITVPSAGNTGLKKVTQETSGTNLIAKAEVSEILGTYKNCTLGEKEKTGKEVGEVLGEGLKAL